MSRRTRGRRQPPPDLTSLFDVLFIVIFAALIRAAAVQQAAAHPAPPAPKPPVPPVKLEVAQLHARAVAALDEDLHARPSLIVRISAAGSITSLETDGKVTPLDTPLLEHSPDPDIALAYLGDRSGEQRVCRVAAVHLALPDLARYLVILAPDKTLADLPHALVEGLRRDVEHCLFEQRGLAVIVDPTIDASVTTPAPSPSSGVKP